jgi:rRNA maturation protein Nop10
MVDLPAMIDSYTLQPSIPSDGGTVTTASPRHS